jgi:hypothetical protein
MFGFVDKLVLVDGIGKNKTGVEGREFMGAKVTRLDWRGGEDGKELCMYLTT